MSDADPQSATDQKFLTITLFEAGLGVLAIGLGYLMDLDPRASLPHWQDFPRILPSILWGLLAGAALFGLLWLSDWVPWKGIEKIHNVLEKQAGDLFVQFTVLEWNLICLCAGIGEELLFRGWLQNLLLTSSWLSFLGDWQGTVGLAAAAILFGLCHAINLPYFVMASIMGLLLGLLFFWTENLLLVMIAHGFYDSLVVYQLLRKRGRSG